MSTVKITELPLINQVNANTANTLFVGVDVPTNVTGKMTIHTLAQGLYSNEILNVGNNIINLPNTIAQFSLSGNSYIQTNLVNLNDGGTADIVVTANTGSGGTDSTNFIDMGYANKDFLPGSEFNNIGTAINPKDGYLYVQGTSGSNGGNLIVGTTTSNTQLRFIVGGGTAANIVARMTSNSFVLNTQSFITFADGTVQSTAAAAIAYTQAAFDKANTTPTQNANTSSYASKYLVEYNPVSKLFSYSSYPDASNPYITGYGAEIHVSPVAFDDSGKGTLGDPVKTIARAKVLLSTAFETTATGQRKTIILHPGNYVEDVTIDTQFTVLTTRELIGKNTTLSGTLTLSKGCTIDGLKMTNLVVSATSANGSVDLIGCTVTTVASKTSTAYTVFRGCDLSTSTLNITGSGTTALIFGNYGFVTVNNASAGVLAKAVVTMGPTTLTAGTLQISDTIVYSANNTANAITQSAGSVLTLNNSQALIPDLTNVARLNLGGFYSILHSVYDKPNSTLSGVSLNSISYNQYLNADRLILASGGQITFPDNSIQTTSGIANTSGVITAGNFNVSGNLTAKSFIYTPTVYPGAQTAITIDFANNSVIRAQTATGLVVTLSNLISGKEVILWITNTAGSNQTFTHGVSALNSTTNTNTHTIPATSTILARYMSIDGTTQNTFISITKA